MSDVSGFLITLEGGEGSGKSHAIKELGVWMLSEFGITPVVTREPGGTPAGEEIRKILLDKKELNISFLTETLLFQAARAQIVEEVIRPSLLQGRVVLLDRFIDSSTVYQGSVRGVGVENVKTLNCISTKDLIPDCTFLFDVDPEVGLSRKRKTKEFNRLDGEDAGFHERVRWAYLREAKKDETGRFVVIDANLEKKVVLDLVKEKIKEKLSDFQNCEGRIRRIER